MAATLSEYHRGVAATGRSGGWGGEIVLIAPSSLGPFAFGRPGE